MFVFKDGNRTRGLEAEDAENVYEDVFSSELTACSNLGFKDSCLEINKGRNTGVKTSCTGYKSLDRKDEDLYQFLVYLQVQYTAASTQKYSDDLFKKDNVRLSNK